jgi:DNA-binding NarL/FixJ family response regulator
MEETPIRVMIADDHPVILEGLRALLAQSSQITVVGTARSFDEVRELLTTVETDVLVLDLGGMGGSALALLNRLRREKSTLGVIIFSSNIDLVGEMLRAGARGYVTKEELITELLNAITAVVQGETFLSPNVQAFLEHTDPKTPLSAKELIALKLLAQGYSTVEIAEQMGIDPRSVQNHITILRRKTGCMQRVQLVDWYRRMYSTSTGS